MIHLDGSSRWRDEQLLKFGWIIWMDHICGAAGWR